MIAAIWDDVIVTDDSLIHAISVLRRTLGDERQQPRFIQTIPRRGYRFVATVAAPAAAPIAAAGESPAATAPAQAIAAARSDPAGASGRPARTTRAAAIAAVAVIGLLVAGGILVFSGDDEPAPSAAASIRLFQPAPPDSSIVSGGILSPDGRYLAFVARDESNGGTGLWLRALQTDELRRLRGTSGASKPFWSPDSRRIGFFASGQLHAIDIGDESVRTIAMAFAAAGGTWGSNDTILFAEWTNGLFAVPASGDGGVSTIAALDRDAQDIAIAWPQFFPDGRRFLYQIVSLDSARSGIYVGDLDSGPHVRLLETSSSATLAPPHHLLHVENDMLIAEELDPEHAELTGKAIVVARGVSVPSLAAENIVSASADLIAFQHGVVRQNLAWFDRAGRQLASLRIPTGIYNPRISPDGVRLAGTSALTTDPGLWLVRLDREESARIETDAMAPVWSPDSREIAFASRNGFSLFVRSIDGSGTKRLLASDNAIKIPSDWSPDGRLLIFSRSGIETGLDLWALELASGESWPLLATAHGETQARVSPDGRWIAYASDESGVLETYVARFPGMDQRALVSTGGGGQPQWSPDQSELYYLSADRAVMAVGIDDNGPVRYGPPRQLLRAAIAGDPDDGRDFFAADADGSRFLIDLAAKQDDGQAITIMVNWAAGMQDQQLASTRALQTAP